MPIRHIVTRGFGNGTFSSRFEATRGYEPGLIGLTTSYTFTGQNATIEESQPAVFTEFTYHPLIEKRTIVGTPQDFISIILPAGRMHTYVMKLFNAPTDKFLITIGMGVGQDISVATWFSNTPAGNVIKHTIPLTRHAYTKIQMTQSPIDIFDPCDQFGVNLPAGTIFFNFRNKENRDTTYTMLITPSPSC